MKHNESDATDKLVAEKIECSPKDIFGLIVRILQLISWSKNHTAVLRRGNLLPLPKSLKAGVNVNVRPDMYIALNAEKSLVNMLGLWMLGPS